jgi:endonuclease/exonuclease/phosphatase family metal-dependent hydrolase
VVPARGHGKEFLEMSTRSPRRRWIWALAAICAGASLAVPAAASAKPTNVKVMSRNLYLGADLAPALLATTQVELFEEAFNVTDAVRETNFTARARLLAAEIAAERPHLIGLQEVALWRRGPVGVFDGPETPATEVVYDFLDELRNQLRNRGLSYRVAEVQNQTDFEVPIDNVDDDMLGAGGNPGNLRDARLTMRDAILARSDVKVNARQSDNYNTALPVDIAPDGTGPEDIFAPRGWTAANVKVKTERFRFVNTHLEAFSAFIRRAQASELVAADGPTDSSLPVVLVGDLNSDPEDPSISPMPPEPAPTPNADAYNLVRDAGFFNRGVTVDTCCHDADLLNEEPDFGEFSRIDHVLTDTPGRVRGLAARLVGVDPELKTPTGLWPSDHAGVVARLRIR